MKTIKEICGLEQTKEFINIMAKPFETSIKKTDSSI